MYLVLFQDSMNMLFTGKGAASRGSLYQIKNKFGHRSVKKKIADCINHVVDFWDFATAGYICLLVCQLKNLTSLEDIPADFGDDKEAYLSDLCKTVVDIVWPAVNEQSIIQAGDDDLEVTIPYCDQEAYHSDANLDSTIEYWDEYRDTEPFDENNCHPQSKLPYLC